MLLGLYIIIAVAFYATPGDFLDKATNLISGGN